MVRKLRLNEEPQIWVPDGFEDETQKFLGKLDKMEVQRLKQDRKNNGYSVKYDDSGDRYYFYIESNKAKILDEDLDKVVFVKFSSKVAEIWDDCFQDCKNLEKIVIPNNITGIGVDAFNGCTSLSSVILPKSLKFIGEDAFNGCTSLSSIKLNEGLEYIGSRAFKDTNITSITLPKSIKTIGEDHESCFTECIKHIYFHDRKMSINDIDSLYYTSCYGLSSYMEDKGYDVDNITLEDCLRVILMRDFEYSYDVVN